MKTTSIIFKNKPLDNGTLVNITIDGCLIANNGTPNASRPQILIHLPKNDDSNVDGSWVEYDGFDWHVIGTTVSQMVDNTPTPWNRYAIAERIRIL